MMGSAGLSKEIKIVDPLERRLVADVAVAGMSSVVRGRFDIENLATQLITDAAAVGMQQQRTKQISDDYHQSKKASGGAGHITQTTIEQQWENQLINDAEFTANTHLPSITFDVNKVDVSQQLGERVGEEVSHFYHPTPAVRNTSGFWQGVNDVLKMREGTIEAFSSVLSNHYQTPNDRWEAIGYAAGVPLAMGAEFIATEGVLGLEAIENVYQGTQRVFGSVATKLEKWGLFGNNGVTETPLTYLSPTELEVTHPRTMGRKAFAILVKHIKENGINETVKYIEYNDKNYVVDGNHRLVAARTLDLSEIPVEKVELPYLGYRTIDDFDFYNPGLSNK